MQAQLNSLLLCQHGLMMNLTDVGRSSLDVTVCCITWAAEQLCQVACLGGK